MKPTIIIIGGGGHCRSCIEAIESTGVYEIAGIVDREVRLGQSILGYPVVASDEGIPDLVSKSHFFLIGVGQLKDASLREKIYQDILQQKGNLPNILASTSLVSASAKLGISNTILHRVLINAGVRVGNNNIINTGAILEHDVVIGDHNHISTGAILNGGVKVGDRCFIGSGTVLIQGVSIADNVVVGAGAVVLHDLDVAGVYAGVPAKRKTNHVD